MRGKPFKVVSANRPIREGILLVQGQTASCVHLGVILYIPLVASVHLWATKFEAPMLCSFQR